MRLKKRFILHMMSVFTIALLVALFANTELTDALFPITEAEAVDSPNFHSGARSGDSWDYFEESGVWYIVTKKPEGSKPGEVYAAGARDRVTKLVIPYTFKHNRKDYIVLGVNDWGFNDNQSLTSVEIKDGVKYIGERAFCSCENIESAKIADSVNEMGREAFSGCSSLKSLKTPDNLKALPDFAFTGCGSLKSVELGKKTVSIGEGAFADCVKLKTVKFNKALKEIGYRAFGSCSALENVKFTANITTLGRESFSYCTSLKSVKLPKKLKEIPYACFEWCENLKTVKLPAGLVSIGDGAFQFCTKLTKVTGKNKKLEYVGYGAFSHDSELASISLGNVKEIGAYAFSETGIKKIDLGTKLEKMGESAFFQCSRLESITIPGTLKVIPQRAFEQCGELKKAVLKDGVERIEDSAFQYNSKMTVFEYPKSLYYVSYSALEKSAWLEIKLDKQIGYNNVGSISYNHQNNTHDPDSISINNCCIFINTGEYYLDQNGYEVFRYKEEITFPAGTKVISCTFATPGICKKVVIPEGVEILDGFINIQYNTAVDAVEVVLPSSLKIMTSWIHGPWLKSITLPENLEELGTLDQVTRGGFYDSEALEKVTIKSSKLKFIGTAVFRATPNLKEIYLPEGIEEIGFGAFERSGIEKVILPYTLKKIGTIAFAETKLESIELPDGVEEIEGRAFENTPLRLVTTPNNIKIGDYSCVLPDKIKTMGWNVFSGTELNKFTLPDNFEIESEITDNRSATIYVKKNSKAHKALEKFRNNYTDLWKVKFK